MTGSDPLLAYLAYLADHDARCPECDYSLRGLTEGRCPECGQGLRLAVVAARTPRPHQPWVKLAAHPIAIVLVAAFGLGLMEGPPAAGAVFLVWAALFAAIWLRNYLRWHTPEPGEVQKPMLRMTLTTVLIALTVAGILIVAATT